MDKTASHTWEPFVGQIVDGNFPLVQLLAGSESAAVFLTERHDGDRIVKAAIKLVPAATENRELQLSRWRMAAELSHPHLIRLFETGSCDLGGIPLLYAVMECAEENLAQVLSQRALMPAEARSTLDPLLSALGYLHAKGLVHGRIKPANIMAIGDELKLSADGILRAGEPLGISADAPVAHANLYDPPESAGRGEFAPQAKGPSPAGDVWSLGMTLVEVLTRNLPALGARGNDLALPAGIPEPFLDIARHCLVRNPDDRWTVAQIADRLEGRASAPPAAAVPPQARTVRSAGAASQPAVRARTAPARRRGYGIPVGIGLAIGLLLAAILLAPKLFRSHSEVAQAPAAAATVQELASPQASPPRAPLAAENEPAIQPASDTTGGGEVIERVLPDVPQSARKTIQGKVRVTVRLDVDSSGDVQFAELAAPGPSKYFASMAMQAAQHWGFRPPKVSGQNVLSTWTLRFEFTRAGTTVVPTQVAP